MNNEQIGVCEIAPGTNISLSMIININIIILLIANTAILSKIFPENDKIKKKKSL